MKKTDYQLADGILFTDEYQFTMAQLYYRMGLHERQAQFDHFFRSYPDYGTHQAGYCINAGLEWLLDYMREVRFDDASIDLLRGQTGRTGKRRFDDYFLNWLRKNATFDAISLSAIPEGRVVHPGIPLTVIEGPLAIAQILETPLLNQLNFQTLVATKAARIYEAGRGQPLLEFGLRRAQGRSANAGVRAALIGGAGASSNVGISHVLGYQPAGTHAHSMVQVFMALGEGELAAFQAYADVYPDDCLLLVDTIDTLESGVPNAIRIFERLRRNGHEPVGIRLDSGDLAYLSVQAARMLNDAGFPDVRIVLSNQIDELVLLQILAQIREEARQYNMDAEAVVKRLMYGVGTRLITSEGHPALDGVYKLVSVQNTDNTWIPAIKISESTEKVPNPGQKSAWRIYDKRGRATADLLTLKNEDPQQGESLTLHHPAEHNKWRVIPREDISEIESLWVEVLKTGKPIYDLPDIESIRHTRQRDLERLDTGVRRIISPHLYHVSLSPGLWNVKQDLINQAKSSSG